MRLVRAAPVMLLLAASVTQADVDTFQEGVNGYTGNQDTYLDEQFPGTQNGSAGSVLVENSGGQRQHGLIRFDNIFGPGADQIPFGSVINSASLTVNVTNTSASGAQIRLHRMMPLASWPETATWNSMSGGIQADDAEAMSVHDAQVATPATSGPETITGLATALQAWSSGATNNGWALISNSSDGWDFDSAEDGTAGNRPLLTVDWGPGYTVSGRVFEDADFAGTATDYDGGVSDLALSNVDVELYDNTDTYISSTTTDGSGNFFFPAVADGSYKIRVRAATIGDSNTPPAGTFNAACGITDPASGTGCVVPEQTWGNGAAAYGGQSATADDTATNNDAGPGDSWLSVAVSGADVPDVNFGFAYNLIVNTGNNGQGSLTRFIDNANAIGSAGGTTANSSEFRIPATDPGFSAGVAVISPVSPLPAISDAGTVIDGSTQTTNNGNTNPAVFGTGGTVGVDAIPLPTFAGPEIEIQDGAGLLNGLRIQADNVTIRGFAIFGFGASNEDGAIRIDAGASGTLIEDNVVGTTATAFVDPGAADRNWNSIVADGGTSGTIQNNLTGFGLRGIYLTGGATGWTVRGNEIQNSTPDTTDGDGIAVNGGSDGALLEENLIVGSSSQGFVVTASNSINFVNNTLIGNGIGSTTTVAQSAAITMRSTTSATTIDRNIIRANYGAGIQVNSGASGILITRNSIADNGTITSRPPVSLGTTGQIGIDLNAAGDDGNFGTAPFVTINDDGDGDSGGNGLLNYAIIETAEIIGTDLVITGWSPAAAVIEIFIADSEPRQFGEGETYLTTQQEGVADGDSSSTSYASPINGLNQGSDSSEPRFSFTIPLASLAAPVNDGDQLTATATLGGNTSEFGGHAPVVDLSTISGRVFEDADFAGTASDYDGGTNDLALANVDVELYYDDDTYITSTITDGSGNYSFPNQPIDDYKIRVRTATIGDSNTPPAGTFNAACGITDPASGVACAVAEQTWSNGAAAYGGQTDADDTGTIDNAGPGDTWVSVSLTGADITDVNFGFAYNLIVNTKDAGQGSLRRFIENANAIGAAAGTTANTSEFRIPLTDPNYNAGLGAHTITLAAALPALTDSLTVIDGQTQTDNVGSTNAADITHPFYGAAKSVGTGVDGIAGTGDEFTLPAYPNPEIEINGNDAGSVFLMTGDSGTVRGLAIYNSSPGEAVLISAGTGNIVEENYVGTRADGSDPGAGLRLQHGLELTGGSGIIRNNFVAFSESGGSLVASTATVSGNDYLSHALLSASGDAISTESSSGQAITIRDNRIHDSSAYAIETWNAPGPFTIENNTASDSGNGGGSEIGGIRLFGTGSVVRYNISTDAVGAGIMVAQTGGSNEQNLLSRNSTFANGGLGIDIEATDFVSPDGDGVTANDGAMNGGLPNDGMDYPVLTVSTLSGSTLHVEGYVGTAATKIAAVHTLEFYVAADDGNNNGEIEVGDALNVPHGEGQTFIDSCATAVDGTFDCDLTVPAAVTLSIGDDVTGIAYDSNSNTSEFGASSEVIAAPTTSISGTIFVDTAGDGLADGPIGPVPNAFEAGARVELFQAGPDGDADGGDDTYIGFTTSSAVDGSYSFTGLTPDIYYVTVDSQGVDDGPYNGSYNATDTWAEQTYGPIGAASFDGVSTWTYAVSAGAFYGGAEWDVSDDFAPTNSLPTAEHIARVDISGGDVSNVDFGFSFNVVTTTRDGVPDPGTTGDQTIQGSLRQFATNANAQVGANTMRFVPAAPTNATLAGNNWWRIVPTVPFPNTTERFLQITDGDTTIDGTAYSATDGVTVVNSNTAALGINETVGVDGIYTTPVLDPELEIWGSSLPLGSRLDYGFDVAANDAVVEDIAIYGFDTMDVLVSAGTGQLIQRSVFGSDPATAVDPGAASSQYGLRAQGSTTGTVRDSIFRFADNSGLSILGTGSVWLVEQVEFSQISGTGDGFNVFNDATLTANGNLMALNADDGFSLQGSGSVFVGDNNTIRNNTDTGVVAQVTPSAILTRNIIRDNGTTGVIVRLDAENVRLSENVFIDNGATAIDLTTTPADGVTANSAAPPACGLNGGPGVYGNREIDFPVIDTAEFNAGNTTVHGFACAGALVEVYEAAGDTNGEGIAFLGSVAADGVTGEWNIVVTGVSPGDDVSAIAIADPNPANPANTSEFSANFAVVSSGSVSGTVFEDIAGNVLAGGESIGDASNPTVNGVELLLYNDDGATAGQPDATDTLRAGPVATAGAGAYNFTNLPDGTYWVVADSRTVSPSAGIHPSYLATTPWAEQTYGPDRGRCANGVGGTTERVGAGPCFGGADGAADDDATTLTSAEHLARVVITGGAVANVDFGFSYSVVTNVEPAGDPSLTASTYQGSLDQFVRNANAINGANAMRFVPAVPINAAGSGGAWWQIDYTGSAVGETISNTHDGDTSINGTAYDLSDGVTVRDTNPGNLGANAGGGLTVGVDGLALPQVARPELEVMRSDSAIGVAFYFYSNSSTGQVPNNFAVRDVATWGFVGGVGMTGIAALRPTGVVIERNVIGAPADSFADPAVAGTLRGVALLMTDAATIRDNLIGFIDSNGVSAADVTATTISGNEIRDAAQVSAADDGINYGAGGSTGTITGNLVVNAGGMGIDGTATGNLVENNTVTGAGQLGVQVGGIRQTGSGNTIRRNVVTGSVGPGVIVPDTVNANTVTENEFGANGSIAIDLVAAGGDTAAGDGILLNDGLVDSNEGNDGLDYPIIDSAALNGGNLTVTGFARSGVTIEFYEAIGAADDDNLSGNPHGEGITYLFTATEGVADADATTGASYTDPGYGADPDVDRFSFTVAAPAGLAIGDELSAVASLAANGSSEFGPNFTVTGPLAAISGTVFEDTEGNVLDGGESIGDAGNPTVNGVDVWLYNDDGATADQPDATDTLSAGPIATAGSGAYSFPGVADGTYWVVADSQGLGTAPAWAEQTYGPAGGWCADGAGGTSENASAGTCYGGRRTAESDDLSTWHSGAEHLARVVVAGGAVSNVDFGFSFNAVTSTRGGSSAADPGATGAQTVQGSLRQFLQNANALPGANAMRFVPAEPTNAALGGNNWWRIPITDQLPDLVDAGTIVDGFAYSRIDGATPSNTNAAAIGSGAAVGVSGSFVTPLLDPELEILGDGVVSGGLNALASADNTEIRNLAITAFPIIGVGAIGILPDPLDSLVIENNVIGTSPASFADDPSLFVGSGISVRDLSNSTIRNNLVGWNGRGLQISFDTVDTLIESNEVRGSDTWGVYLNGVAGTSQQAERITLRGNLIEDNGFEGINGQQALSDITIDENTLRLNSWGIRLYGVNNSVTGNIITDNGNSGLLVVGDGSGSYPAATTNLISRNHFGNNSGLGIDLVETGNGGDGATLNDDADPDLGANELLNFPIIEAAQILGPNLVVTGFAAPGSTIEFYIADADPSGFGEGIAYLFTVVEGSGADTDATTGSYGPGPINGLVQGTDTSNRYRFSVPTPAGVSVGTELTATGTLLGATSEFSGRAAVSNDADLVITKVLDPSTPGPFGEGDSVTYLLTVTNNGPAQATNVTATDTYPSELTLGVPVPSAPTSYAAGTGVWTIGTLLSGASATLQLPGTVNAGTSGDVVTNSVTAASGDQADPTTAGDDLDETLTVLPLLSIDDVVQVETDPVPGTTIFTFTASINQSVAYDVTFDIDTADNTATVADSDYVAISGLGGTITAGSGSTTIDVTVNGDGTVEADETFFVNLSNVVGAAVADAQGQGTITNDDGANVSIAATTDASEAGPVDGQFTVTQSATSVSDTVVSYTVAGTATPGGTDYASLSGTVTVLAGDTAATIDVTGIVADALVEGDETVIVTLSGTDNPGIPVAASPADTATVNILDNSAATVSIAATTNGAETGPVDGVFTVTQSAIATNDTVISYAVAGSATSGADYTALSGTVTVPGGATTATIVVPVIDDAVAEIIESVDVTLTGITASDPGIGIAAGPDDAASITIAENDSDLVTTKSVNNAAPMESDTISYTLTVTNSAGAQATNVALTDVLPAGVTYVSDDGGGAYDNATGVWSIGTLEPLAPNNTATLIITATVDAGAASLAQPITNTTTAAAGDQTDPGTVGDSLSASITVNANADLVTTKTVDNASPVEGASIVYTLTVFNNGAAQATNVSLTDLLPAGVSYTGDDSGGAYNPVTGIWAIGTLNDGEIATLNITATVDVGAAALAQPISNTTTAAAGDQPDPDATTDDLSADITVNYNADLVTTKVVDSTAPLAGDTVIYTLSVTNNGPAPATNVSLTDSLPAGVTYVSDDGAGAYAAGSGVWSIGSLANGATATLNISADVDSGAGLLPQPITNTTTAAAGDQIDPDSTTDDLTADINVALIDANLIRLTKTVGRDRATIGEIVTYSIELRNTVATTLSSVQVSDVPARGFKYVPGTAQLNGAQVPDPTTSLPIEFDIGSVPGFVDGNGNGIADPGEPGYVVLSYRMVAGAGVAPGVWANTAVATAGCETCFVSNPASADIEITEDTLFDLGTIIGKVFYDTNRDGWQDPGETGVPAAMVALDDGSYALTDEFGRYHFPAVKPGQRLLKINLKSLVGQALATTDRTRILSVTPGLMAKANFGVITQAPETSIGSSGEFGVAVDSKTLRPPLVINGSTSMLSLLVNGMPVPLASADVQLGVRQLEEVVELSNGKLSKPIVFSTAINTLAAVESWELTVTGAQDEVARSWQGSGTPPATIKWNGIRNNGKLVNGGGVYTYHLQLETADGQQVSSGRRLFGVNRLNTVSLNLSGGAFITGSHELTSAAKKLLSETAEAIRAFPEEIIAISGHTDDVGSDESNLALSERRARAAYDFLHSVEGLPEEQFVVQAFGETRPIASNDTAWGRELNRRVEISGDLDSIERAKTYDAFQQAASVRINDTSLDVDDSGSFRAELAIDNGQDTLDVRLSTAQGRSVTAAVRLPALEIISPQGQFAIPIDSAEASRVERTIFSADNVLSTMIEARTEPGNSVTLNGDPLAVDESGHFSAPISLRIGDNYFGLVARNPDGMLRIANLLLTVNRSSINRPEAIVSPIPDLALQLPPPGVPMTKANLLVPGHTTPGNEVFINDRRVNVDADGNFLAEVTLKLGDNPFKAEVVDPDGNSGEIEQVIAYNGNPMFFMALVDGTFSQLETTGSLDAAGAAARRQTVSEGRIAYYLKGHVRGKFLLTSAFDSGQQELGDIFSDLTKQDNRRLLTNLDPDTLYPVYGDSSTVVYDAQSQSKFYLALESETVTALIGNYALNFTDTELAGYQRTLYGASATYQSTATDSAGNAKTKAQAFYANIAQAHVRDEMRATGGSLYYLSQRDVIEGSEHVSVIVRDQDSGLILERRALQPGLDYSIDYVDGRLLTNRPISSFSADNSLIGSDLLGGSAVYLQIDYETAVDGFEQTASGGRIRQVLGDRLALGVTAVDEEQLAGQYSLQASDAELRLSKNSRLLAEYASSEGNNSFVNISEDGGLSYQAVAQTPGSAGDAYKIAAEIDAGEWFGAEDRLLLNTYFKHLDTGFSANSVTSEQGSEMSGVAASWKISATNTLLGRYERQLQLVDGSENTLGTVQWSMVRELWGLAAEFEDRAGYGGDSTFAALRMNYRWTDALSSTFKHQQTLAGLENNQSTLGVAYRASDKLTLDASTTYGTMGTSAQLGAHLEWRGNRLYAAQQLNDLAASGPSNNRLLGIESPFGPDGTVYSEYRWSTLPTSQQKQMLFGTRQRFQVNDGLKIEVSGEHSAEDASSTNVGERYAVSLGATYANDGGLTLSMRNEYRKDSRSIESEQFLSTTNMEYALGDSLAVLAKYRFSQSESSAQVTPDIDFTEASIGLAYRPVAHDRLNLLARYTRLSNTPTEFQTASSVTSLSSDIVAVDWSYQLSRRIEWVGKQALRRSEDSSDSSGLVSLTSLAVQRLNWTLPKSFLLGTEYRLTSQDVADDSRSGFVTEVMWEGLDPLRLGVGYNFSDVSDNEFAEYNFSTSGVFLRVQGKF